MSDRTRAWCWAAGAVIAILIELGVYAWWRKWFFMIRDGHWIAVAISAYYFGRSSKRGVDE